MGLTIAQLVHLIVVVMRSALLPRSTPVIDVGKGPESQVGLLSDCQRKRL